jgi:hypothetical protein
LKTKSVTDQNIRAKFESSRFAFAGRAGCAGRRERRGVLSGN